MSNISNETRGENVSQKTKRGANLPKEWLEKMVFFNNEHNRLEFLKSNEPKFREECEIGIKNNPNHELFYTVNLFALNSEVDHLEICNQHVDELGGADFTPIFDPIQNWCYGVLYSLLDNQLCVKYFMASARVGFPLAQMNLGILYENGIYFQKDVLLACLFYQMAANPLLLRPTAPRTISMFTQRGVSEDFNTHIGFNSLAAFRMYSLLPMISVDEQIILESEHRISKPRRYLEAAIMSPNPYPDSCLIYLALVLQNEKKVHYKFDQKQVVDFITGIVLESMHYELMTAYIDPNSSYRLDVNPSVAIEICFNFCRSDEKRLHLDPAMFLFNWIIMIFEKAKRDRVKIASQIDLEKHLVSNSKIKNIKDVFDLGIKSFEHAGSLGYTWELPQWYLIFYHCCVGVKGFTSYTKMNAIDCLKKSVSLGSQKALSIALDVIPNDAEIRNVLFTQIRENPSVISKFKNLRNVLEVALYAVRSDPMTIRYFSPDLRSNLDVVKLAVSKDRKAFGYVSLKHEEIIQNSALYMIWKGMYPSLTPTEFPSHDVYFSFDIEQILLKDNLNYFYYLCSEGKIPQMIKICKNYVFHKIDVVSYQFVIKMIEVYQKDPNVNDFIMYMLLKSSDLTPSLQQDFGEIRSLLLGTNLNHKQRMDDLEKEINNISNLYPFTKLWLLEVYLENGQYCKIPDLLPSLDVILCSNVPMHPVNQSSSFLYLMSLYYQASFDFDSQLRFLRRAYESRNPFAMIDYACLLYNGKSDTRMDQKKALSILKICQSCEISFLCDHIQVLISKILTLDPSEVSDFEYLLAEQNQKDSPRFQPRYYLVYLVSWCYMIGRGVLQDEEFAYKMYTELDNEDSTTSTGNFSSLESYKTFLSGFVKKNSAHWCQSKYVHLPQIMEKNWKNLLRFSISIEEKSQNDVQKHHLAFDPKSHVDFSLENLNFSQENIEKSSIPNAEVHEPFVFESSFDFKSDPSVLSFDCSFTPNIEVSKSVGDFGFDSDFTFEGTGTFKFDPIPDNLQDKLQNTQNEL